MKIPRKKTIIITSALILVLASIIYIKQDEIIYYLVGGYSQDKQATKDFKNDLFLKQCLNGQLPRTCGADEIWSGGITFEFYGKNNAALGNWQQVSPCFIGRLHKEITGERNSKQVSCSELFNTLKRYNQECNDCIKVKLFSGI